MEKKEGLEIVKRLVQQFGENRREFISSGSGYSEPRLRSDFLDPFLEALGWDVINKKGVSQFLREVIIEDTVDVEDEEASLKKKPDYALCAAGERKFFLEAKKPAVPILTAIKPAFQIRRYGWNAKIPISVLSNFDKLIIYDCRYRPQPEDNARIARIKSYNYTEYVEKFDEIYDQLSYESVCSGKFDELFATDEEISGTELFDQYFLQQIERWRKSLAQNIYQLNQRLSNDEINFLTQRLLNRIIFLRICEDREIEKYKALKEVATYDDLKKLFQEADKRYDSALFDFIEDQLSLEIKIDGNVLISIFQELYYPQSPYAFSVVEANVLGQIYEHFLASEIRIGNTGNINIVQKPEVVAANGVVPTPQYIVENIIKKTSIPLHGNKSPNQLTNFRIADIDCGSGIFLLTAYEDLLNYHLEWYLKDGHLKHKDKLHSIKGNRWQLTLFEKQRILLNNIWGVDIDPQAVEVTRFSLLLKVIEGETSATIDAHLGKYHQKALPNLNKNIQCGNSLVDKSYFDYDPAATTSAQVFNTIRPFVWKDQFPEVMKEGGFDVIVGNPPYIRIQNMVHYSPQEIRYYQSPASPFSCARNNNFDKYSLFIERALTLLKPRGRLGYILPHKFFKIKSGEALRKHISLNRYLIEVVYFGAQQVFGKTRSTYTCILVLGKESSNTFSVEHVNKLGPWRYGTPGTIDRYSAEDIDEKPWIFIHPKVRVIFDRIKREHQTLLKDVANIFVGVQTSADKIYILKSVKETANSITFNDQDGMPRTIEKEILRPCLLDVKFSSFGKPKANSYIIFPYKIVQDQAILYSKNEMSKKFPLCWKYLNSYKEKLSQRNVPNRTDENWYQYGRSQSLTKFNGEEKLIWPVLSLEPKYVYDENNIVITGGGNGPYYALRLKQPTPLSLFYIQAVLSHPIIEAIVQAGASTFRGGYGSHGKQFIENLPICQINFGNSKEQKILHYDIVKLVKQLIKTTVNWSQASIPDKKEVLSSQRVVLINQINEKIGRLYNITAEDLQVLKDFPVVASESEEDLKQ